MGGATRSGNAANSLKEINDKIHQLENDFSIKLSQFKDSIVSKESSDGSGTLSGDTAAKFELFETNIWESVRKIKEEVNKKLNDLECSMDEVKQKYNNKSLLLHGVPEKEDNLGDVDDMYRKFIQIAENKLQVHIEKVDIFDCYRLGKNNKDKTRPRPLVIEFTHKWKRDEIYYSKRKLKGSQLMLTEFLTVCRLQIFKKCSQVYREGCWTTNGRVVVIHNGKKVFINNADGVINNA